MSDGDPTEELPGAPDTEPTIIKVMERVNRMDERLTAMQDLSDRRHAEILGLFKDVRDDIGAVRDEIAF